MTENNNRLGKGLSSLLGERKPSVLNSDDIVKNININSIVVNPFQPRKDFKMKELEELATSIKEYGILQPLIVRAVESGKYEIIAGERRYRAAKLIGLTTLPVIIREFDEQKTFSLSIIENIQREDLNVVEEAKAYNILIEKYNFTQQNISDKIGKSRSHIANLLRLLTLPEKILEYLVNGKIEMGHARALVGFEYALDNIDYIIDNKLTVRDVEKLVKGELIPIKKPRLNQEIAKDLKTKENLFKDKFGFNCKIKYNEKNNKGTMTIKYDNLDKLNELLKCFM